MQRSASFMRAIGQFKKALPSLRTRLVDHFEAELQGNSAFRDAFASCYEVLRVRFQQEYQRPDPCGMFARLAGLTPDFTEEKLLIFLVQHFVLEPVLSCMFPRALTTNQMARQVEHVMQVLGNRDWLRLSVDGYLSPVEGELRAAPSDTERQQVFTTVCEYFLNGFDAHQAEGLGIIYTPAEVVDFMCGSCELQLQQTYGRSLSAANVPILDPCVGTGSFLVNVIGRIDAASLLYKYEHELFGVEILLMPYYLATLNIEQAFFKRCGYYVPFPGLRYADALLS